MAFSMTIQATPRRPRRPRFTTTSPVRRYSLFWPRRSLGARKHAFGARSASVNFLPCRVDIALPTAVRIPCPRRPVPGRGGHSRNFDVHAGLLGQPVTATAANGSFVIAPAPAIRKPWGNEAHRVSRRCSSSAA